jgi:hypothetical protein
LFFRLAKKAEKKLNLIIVGSIHIILNSTPTTSMTKWLMQQATKQYVSREAQLRVHFDKIIDIKRVKMGHVVNTFCI